MRVVLSIACAAVVALVGGSTAVPQTLPIRSEAKVQKQTVRQEHAQAAQLKRLARKVGTFRTATWDCQDTLGIKRTRASASVWALPQSVAYRGWVVEQWQSKASSCLKIQHQRTIGMTWDWPTAVIRVQVVHPGTGPWLMSCSGGEGGHGRFVMNTQGSPAGGWMQMYRSTYYAYNDAAFADARARGFVINEKANSWYHPLGQALVAAYMRTHGHSGHWDPRIDAACR